MEGVAIIGGMENFRKFKNKSVTIKGGRWEIDGLRIKSTNLFICNSSFLNYSFYFCTRFVICCVLQ